MYFRYAKLSHGIAKISIETIPIDEAKYFLIKTKSNAMILILKIKIIYVRFFEEKIAKSSSFEKSLVSVQNLKLN